MGEGTRFVIRLNGAKRSKVWSTPWMFWEVLADFQAINQMGRGMARIATASVVDGYDAEGTVSYVPPRLRAARRRCYDDNAHKYSIPRV